MLLIRDDYWFAVEETEPEPTTAAWKKANQKALATIVLFLEDSQMHLVKGATTAQDAWTKLKAYHEKATMTSRVSLLKRICNLNLVEGNAEGPDMERHLFELDELFDRLQCAGQELESSLKIAMVLRSLPDSFDILVTALESRKEEDLTMEIVKQKLLDEWQRRTERTVSASSNFDDRALRSVAKRHEEKVCFYCRKPGHFRRNCRLFLKKQRGDDDDSEDAKQATEKDRYVCFAVRTHVEDEAKNSAKAQVQDPKYEGRSQEELPVKHSGKITMKKKETVLSRKEPQGSEEFVDCDDEGFDYWEQFIGCRSDGLAKMYVNVASAAKIKRT